MAKGRGKNGYKKGRKPADALALFAAAMLATLAELGVPMHFSRHSNRIYTVWQLAVLLAARQREGKSYGRFCESLRSYGGLLRTLGLRRVPHPSTLEKFAVRFGAERLAALVAATCAKLAAEAVPGPGAAAPGTLSVDSTGFENARASKHYDRVLLRHTKEGTQTDRIAVRKHTFATFVVDPASKGILVCHAVDSGVNDHTVFPAVAEATAGALRATGLRPAALVADRGFDSERNREIVEELLGMRAVIPVIKQGVGGRMKGWRRRRSAWESENDLAWREAYGKRQSSETVNYMVKSTKGDDVKGKTEATRRIELMFRALAHNLDLLVRRACC